MRARRKRDTFTCGEFSKQKENQRHDCDVQDCDLSGNSATNHQLVNFKILDYCIHTFVFSGVGVGLESSPFKIFAEEANGAVLDSEQRHSSLEMNAYLVIEITLPPTTVPQHVSPTIGKKKETNSDSVKAVEIRSKP
eukprot:5387337-Amphidinium_carterae.1